MPGVTTTPPPPPRRDSRSEFAAEANKPLPLQLDLPGPDLPQRSPRAGAAPSGGRRTARGLLGPLLGVLLLVGAAAALAVVWAVPWYLRRACIDAAAEHGIALDIDAVTLATQGFHLVGVTATVARIPGATLKVPDILVETRGLHPSRMTLRGAEVGLRGRLAEVEAAATAWRASPDGGQGDDWAPTAFALEGARVVWDGALADNVRLDATDVGAELTWRERDAEIHARCDAVRLVFPVGTVGPWRIDLDRAADGSRVRVALDPGVPEASTLLILGDGERVRSIDMQVPRGPLAHLGLPAEITGLSGDVQFESVFHYVALGPTRSDISARGGVYGIDPFGFPQALDVSWEGSASGNPAAGIDVKNARLAVGPLVGTLSGTFKAFDDGVRADLAWSAGPIPCAALVAPLGVGQPFDIAYALRGLAGKALSNALHGSASAAALLTLDSRNLAATKIDLRPDIHCSGVP
jgi:hypothetical protein